MAGTMTFVACGPDGSLLLWALSPILIPFAVLVGLSLVAACVPPRVRGSRKERRGFEVLPRDRHA